jgi:hypothetical protein
MNLLVLLLDRTGAQRLPMTSSTWKSCRAFSGQKILPAT